jgi:hypothetical protein
MTAVAWNSRRPVSGAIRLNLTVTFHFVNSQTNAASHATLRAFCGVRAGISSEPTRRMTPPVTRMTRAEALAVQSSVAAAIRITAVIRD